MVPLTLFLSNWRPNTCIRRHAGTCEVYHEGRGWQWAGNWEWWPSIPASWSPGNKQGAKLYTGWWIISGNTYIHKCKSSVHAKHIGTRICMLYGPCQGEIKEHRRFLSHGVAAVFLIKASHLKLRASATCWDKWPWSDCGGEEGAVQVPQHVWQPVREFAVHCSPKPNPVRSWQNHYSFIELFLFYFYIDVMLLTFSAYFFYNMVFLSRQVTVRVFTLEEMLWWAQMTKSNNLESD